MEIMIIQGNRYLINTEASDNFQDVECKRIMDQYPDDAEITWDESPSKEDLSTFSLKEIRMKEELMSTFSKYLN